MSRLLVFGAGYSAAHAALKTASLFDGIAGTTRSAEKAARLGEQGIEGVVFDGRLTEDVAAAIAQATHLLISIAPDENGDPVLESCREALLTNSSLEWACYLSTVGVYGDHDGKWVDEETECRPVSKRSVQRLAAERAWRDFAEAAGVPLAIFRLSGIYGPGRNAFVNIERATARRIVKPGQVFNRVHRDDIARAFLLACERKADGIFNITDDEPAPPQDLVTLAHELAGRQPPPEIAFEDADLSPMGRSFYGENKRVSNDRSKDALGLAYGWPNYRDALERMWAEGSWR